MNDYLEHYGTPRHSGRYPYGSGEDPFQHEGNLLKTVDELKSQGFTEKEIAQSLGMSTTELRREKTIAIAEEKSRLDAEIFKLKDEGLNNTQIGERIGKGESYVRNRLDERTQEKAKKLDMTASALKENVDNFNYIDIGPGTEAMMGVSRTKLLAACKKLEDEGYYRTTIEIPQASNPKVNTRLSVLAKPGTTVQELYQHKGEIAVVGGVTGTDGGRTRLGIQKPTSVDSSRIYVRYRDEGGLDRDGTIELRRGVDDLSLGNAHYAQVRIGVDGTNYMKGMAFYSDDIPKGYDIVYNTNKAKGTPLFKKDAEHPETVFKSMKDDPDNPFGSTFKIQDGVIVGQKMYLDKDGKEKLSPINIVREEGDWDTWSKTLASQFLSKQPIQLIKQQLNKSYDDKKSEYDEIMALTNPAIKQELLNSFADDCDASAVHLKAASLPGQSSKVILPCTKIKENEIYAPTYKDGEEVVLIRYPHGGTFEIPRLVVNNKNKAAKDLLGQANDAVGINPKTAGVLSGADFDGDSVVVIPTRNQKIVTKPPLDALKDFEPKDQYALPPGLTKEEEDRLTMHNTQTEMGKISNLITDMTIQGASEDELARAVKHSMVVIDAEKHHLDYKRSYQENEIKELKKKYQTGGASTIISRAKGQVTIDDRKPVYSLNGLSKEDQERYKNGEKLYVKTNKTTMMPIKDDNGKVIGWEEKPKTIKSTQMAETNDAFTLVLDKSNQKEVEYARYANKLKALANESRKEAMTIKPKPVNRQATAIYANEIDSLDAKIKIATMNKPLERKAQTVANVIIQSKFKDNPNLDGDQKKKIRVQALSQARQMTGASKIDSAIKITDKEWEAIQAGAVSFSKQKEIIKNTDKDRLKQLATPRETHDLSSNQIARIKNYANSGHTLSEIAVALGVSPSTVAKYVE